jgi:hypothetical protein
MRYECEDADQHHFPVGVVNLCPMKNFLTVTASNPKRSRETRDGKIYYQLN